MSSVQQLGPYRLLSLLRTGASCQVWEAIPSSGGKRVAIKALMSQFLKDKEARSALKREYDIGKDFDHPRVIHLFNYGSSKEDCYVALELYKAPNMKQMLQLAAQNPDDGDDSMARLFPKVVEQSAEGVAYIHTQGVLHRDLKPHNFLVGDDGEVKLIDFSLSSKPAGFMAKMLGGRSRVVQGTRSYMAPEQIRGRALDERADIYSYGCTMYELFHGKPPFTGATANDLLQKHLRSPAPNISASNRNVTPEFADLLQRCMAKKPDARPQSMEAVLKEVRSIKVYKPEFEFVRR